MGTTRWRSNLAGHSGDETISGFTSVTATTLAATGALTAGSTMIAGTSVAAGTSVTAGSFVKATTYLQLGTNQFMFFGTAPTEASVVAHATAITSTPRGSLYLNASPGELWIFDGQTTATRFIDQH